MRPAIFNEVALSSNVELAAACRVSGSRCCAVSTPALVGTHYSRGRMFPTLTRAIGISCGNKRDYGYNLQVLGSCYVTTGRLNCELSAAENLCRPLLSTYSTATGSTRLVTRGTKSCYAIPSSMGMHMPLIRWVENQLARLGTDSVAGSGLVLAPTVEIAGGNEKNGRELPTLPPILPRSDQKWGVKW